MNKEKILSAVSEGLDAIESAASVVKEVVSKAVDSVTGDQVEFGDITSFEIHITTTCDHREAATKVADLLGWKTSEIARDPILGDDTFFYLTKHTKTFAGAKSDVEAARSALETDGVEVIRVKIEGILFDTKTGIGV